MPAVTTSILSGAAVSSAFAVPDPSLPMMVIVPSHGTGWGAIQVQFSATSAGPYGPMWVAGVASATVFAGAGPGFGEVPRVPAGFARLLVTNSTAGVASFTILSGRH